MPLRFKQILIFSPDTPTGGPEALHQLADVLNSMGAVARMVYIGEFSTLVPEGDTLTCTVSEDAPARVTYREYNAPPLLSAKLTSDTLLIFPEIWIDFAVDCINRTSAQISIWWLSVDNSPLFYRERNYDFENLLFRHRLLHFYQSHYALHMLLERGATNLAPLFDFTSRAFVRKGLGDLTHSKDQRTYSIAYFPNKAGAKAVEFLESLAARNPGVSLVAIKNMSKAEVAETLWKTKIFIDFGHSPGKDRMPREAAALGLVVFVRKVGAARFSNDYPIGEDYFFSDADLDNYSLEQRVLGVLSFTEQSIEAQAVMRNRVALEYEEFALQVRQSFFKSP